jgi:hypothetical protein
MNLTNQKQKDLSHLHRRDNDLYVAYKKMDAEKKYRYDYIIAQLSVKFYMTSDNVMRIIQRMRRDESKQTIQPSLFSNDNH